MRLKAMKKVFALVLACMMLIPALAGFGSFAAETPTVEIVSNNVWYGETLNLMYAIKAENAEGYTFEVTVNGEAVDTYFDGKDTIKGVECDIYIVTKGVAAQNIDTVYTATVTCGEASHTTTYSVLEYLNERLYISEDTTTAQAEMYNALIDHAGKADLLLNGENGIANQVYVNVEGGETGMYTIGSTVTATTTRTPAEGKKLVWEIKSGDNTPITKSLEEMVAGIEVTKTTFIALKEVDEAQAETPALTTATLTFDDFAKQTTSTTTQQVWEENGIVFTYNKAAYTNNLADYANPLRVYKGTSITVAYAAGISKIVFNCNNASYATVLGNSITGSTVDGKVVTVVLDEITTSFTVASLSAQSRIDSIVINPQ